jgi:hypothetical protein
MIFLRRIMFPLTLVMVGAAVILALVAGIWYIFRPLPAPVQNEVLFAGITYTREIVRDPFPQIRHIVSIDLTTPGLTFFVTPRDDIDGFVYRARTTSQFLEEFDLQLAINGDFFNPWRDYHIFDYYPHVGDGVDVRGYTVTQNQIVTEGYAPPDRFATLYITDESRASFAPPDGTVVAAISGNTMLLIENEIAFGDADASYASERHPRTAAALDKTGNTLLLFVVDGRQPNHSDGASLLELVDIVRAYGGWNALNLDGGGSAALVIEDADGKPVVLNSPIHNRIPGRERPVANHLGIRVH